MKFAQNYWRKNIQSKLTKMSFADSSTVFLLSVTGQIASGTFLPGMDDLVIFLIENLERTRIVE